MTTEVTSSGVPGLVYDTNFSTNTSTGNNYRGRGSTRKGRVQGRDIYIYNTYVRAPSKVINQLSSYRGRCGYGGVYVRYSKNIYYKKKWPKKSKEI